MKVQKQEAINQLEESRGNDLTRIGKKKVSFYHLKGIIRPIVKKSHQSKTNFTCKPKLESFLSCCNTDTRPQQQQQEMISLSAQLLSKFSNQAAINAETQQPKSRGLQTPSSKYYSTSNQTKLQSRCHTEEPRDRTSFSFCKTVMQTHLKACKLTEEAKMKEGEDKRSKKKVLIKIQSGKRTCKTEPDAQGIQFRSLGKTSKINNNGTLK